MEHLEPKLQCRSCFPFEIVIARQSDALTYLASQNISAALSCDKNTSRHFVTHDLGTFSHVAVANPNYARRAFEDGFSADTVIKAKTAAYDPSNTLNARFAKQTTNTDLGSPNFKISSFHGILNLCLDGYAWAVLPRHLVQPHIKNGSLVDLCPGAELAIPMFWHVSAFLDDLLADLTSIIEDTAGQLCAA
ncbi:MAG: LysR substrate-binding domain-containing protein [Pseudomonadota bacterium]